MAALLATVVSALVVKCMPLLLAPHHEKARGAGHLVRKAGAHGRGLRRGTESHHLSTSLSVPVREAGRSALYSLSS